MLILLLDKLYYLVSGSQSVRRTDLLGKTAAVTLSTTAVSQSLNTSMRCSFDLMLINTPGIWDVFVV